MNKSRVGRVSSILIAGFLVGSCQTITEEMPTATLTSVPVPVPIIVVPIPQPAPVPSAQPLPSGGGGGGGNGVPIPQPIPIPQTVPTAAPPSGGGNNGGGNNGGGGGCQGNCNPIKSVHAYVYYIQCNGVPMPDTKFASDGPAECDVRLDATPKDERGRGTNIISTPHWTIEGGHRWATPGNPYTPLVFGGHAGEITVSVELDGIRSNTFTYRFR